MIRMNFYELIYAIKVRLTKQMTLNAEVSFDAFGKELGLFGVCFGSLVTYFERSIATRLLGLLSYAMKVLDLILG